MSKYVDAKIRFCPKCNLNVNECKCQDNKVKFVSLTQEKYEEIVKNQEENQNQE